MTGVMPETGGSTLYQLHGNQAALKSCGTACREDGRSQS